MSEVQSRTSFRGALMNVKTPESTDSSSSIHSTLLSAIRHRDPVAWEQLVQIFSPLIYDWCRQQSLQKADSADLTQIVFQAVMSGLDSFRRDRPTDGFRGWLWTIYRQIVFTTMVAFFLIWGSCRRLTGGRAKRACEQSSDECARVPETNRATVK